MQPPNIKRDLFRFNLRQSVLILLQIDLQFGTLNLLSRVRLLISNPNVFGAVPILSEATVCCGGKKNKNVINLNGVKRNITIQIFASHSHEEPRTNNCYIIYSENPFPFLFNCIFSFISMPTFPTFVFFVILSLFFCCCCCF